MPGGEKAQYHAHIKDELYVEMVEARINHKKKREIINSRKRKITKRMKEELETEGIKSKIRIKNRSKS